MKHEAKTHPTRGPVLRFLFATSLVLGGVALLAQADSQANVKASGSGKSAYTSRPIAGGGDPALAAPTAPGMPRFANYSSPPGVGDNSGEPSIGVNWNTEKKFSNRMFEIPNGGTVLY